MFLRWKNVKKIYFKKFCDNIFVTANNKIMKKFVIFLIFLFIFPCFCQNYATAAQTQVEVPILMYHSFLKSKKGAYCVNPSTFEQDILYLREHGYTAMFVEDLINFCEGKSDLPHKPVILSFDDGHYNNLYYALPLLLQYNFKANLNVVGCFCNHTTTSGDKDNPNYSYLTFDEIKFMHQTGLVEIGNHTYAMHSFKPRYGIAQKNGESDSEYQTALENDVCKLENILKEKCGFSTKIFAYPFGKYSKKSEEILRRMGFKAFLTCNEGINKVKKGDKSVLSHLKRINRSGLLSTWQFFSKYKIS